MPDINKAYNWAIDTCNAPNVAYSSDEQLRCQGKDAQGNTCYDCSSFIWYALKAGGFTDIGTTPFWTGSMTTYLLRAGFTEENINGEWKPGDILWRKGHTEMVYTGGIGEGISMGAHSHHPSNVALDVSINSYTSYASGYTKLFRYGNGASGEGYSMYVVAAILGNFYQESQINPGVWQDKQDGHSWTDLGVGFGLGQWTNTNGDTHGRLYQLGTWLTNNGYAPDSGDGQIAYMIYENIWFTGGVPSAYTDLDDFLNSTDTNLTNLTTEWYNHWEGMNHDDGSLATRIEWANYFYNYLSANANSTSVTSWYTKNNFIDLKYSENNAIMFYRALGSGGGGGGTDEGKHRMPVWMMILRKF